MKLDNAKQATNCKTGGLWNGSTSVHICDSRWGVK